MSERRCDICTATSKNGNRCRRTTCKYGPMCWQHTQLIRKVKVVSSRIPNAGLGLFAMKKFRTNDKIIEYTGRRMTEQEVERKWPGDTLAPYAFRVSNSRLMGYIDASRTNTGVGRYANDAGYRGRNRRYRASENNAKVTRFGHRLWVVATEKIYPGDEITVSYNRTYWNM